MKFYKKDHTVIMLNDDEAKPSGFTSITESEYNRVSDILSQLAELKFEIKKTDFKCLKYAEGWYTEEEYAPIKEAREQLRIQIRALQEEL